MKRNLFVSYENFRGRTLTQLVRGYEGRTNPVQLRREYSMMRKDSQSTR